MRPAELLVLQELYATPAEARAALDGAGRSVAGAWVESKSKQEKTLASRLTRMVGKQATKRVAGRLIPGIAIVTNAVSNERDTRALADRAMKFYGG